VFLHYITVAKVRTYIFPTHEAYAQPSSH